MCRPRSVLEPWSRARVVLASRGSALAWLGEVDVDHIGDASLPRAHHHDPRRQEVASGSSGSRRNGRAGALRDRSTSPSILSRHRRARRRARRSSSSVGRAPARRAIASAAACRESWRREWRLERAELDELGILADCSSRSARPRAHQSSGSRTLPSMVRQLKRTGAWKIMHVSARRVRGALVRRSPRPHLLVGAMRSPTMRRSVRPAIS